MRIRPSRLLVLTSLILAPLTACARGEAAAPDGPHPALDVVARYYAAFNDATPDALLETIAADDRATAGIGLPGLLDALAAGFAGLRLDPATRAAARVANVTVELVDATGDYALVRARGDFFAGAPGLQAPLCDLHDVRRGADGRWAIDIDAPERARRLARIAARQEAEIAALLEEAAEADGVFGDKGRVLAVYANRCE